MKQQWIWLVSLVVIAGAALAFRSFRLTDRPFHGDEAIHAWKFGELWDSGKYVYDPEEYHGPTLNYFTLPLMWISGNNYQSASETMYRMVPALFGAGLILLMWIVREDLGYWEMIAAAILTAISPVMVFYSRYYIQEMLLVFFTFLAIAAGWRYVRGGGMGWAIIVGVCVGLMHATKETWVIAAAALFGAGVFTAAWASVVQGRRLSIARALNWKAWVAAIVAALVVIVLFFSAFFQVADHGSMGERIKAVFEGPWNSIIAYKTYFARGTGSGDHNHPWDYYLRLLAWTRYGRGPIWTEAMVLGLAGLGLLVALGRAMRVRVRSGEEFQTASRVDWRRWFGVFIAAYTVLLTAIYAAIPYKTPWCLLGFYHGMILLAGIAAVALVRWMPHWTLKTVMILLLAVGAGQLTWQSWRTNYKLYADRRNPWVYSHPGRTMFELVQRMQELAAVAPQKRALQIRVYTKDIWPIPWYLRDFTGLEYWTGVPADADGQVLICERAQGEELMRKIKGKYQADFFGLRPTVVLQVYIREDLWEAFLETRSR